VAHVRPRAEPTERDQEAGDGTGSSYGVYIGDLQGAMLADPAVPTHGTTGTYDFSGTAEDVMLGRNGAQEGTVHRVSPPRAPRSAAARRGPALYRRYDRRRMV
jgi:hypothetical protein